MRLSLACASLALLVGSVSAQSLTCDEEHGKYCPEESPGPDLIECLQNGEEERELSAPCTGWLKMLDGEWHVTCKSHV